MKNIFKREVTEEVIERINMLTPESKALWGSMSVSQMFAHCCVTYEMAYENIHSKPNVFMRFLLKTFVKAGVVGDKPYKTNLRTAPQFIVKEEKDFETEKTRLIHYITKTQELGEAYFDGKESLSFGVLSIKEWNTMFYKHLDHHLSQFGV